MGAFPAPLRRFTEPSRDISRLDADDVPMVAERLAPYITGRE
jgi:hypothetical protein